MTARETLREMVERDIKKADGACVHLAQRACRTCAVEVALKYAEQAKSKESLAHELARQMEAGHARAEAAEKALEERGHVARCDCPLLVPNGSDPRCAQPGGEEGK